MDNLRSTSNLISILSRKLPCPRPPFFRLKNLPPFLIFVILVFILNHFIFPPGTFRFGGPNPLNPDKQQINVAMVSCGESPFLPNSVKSALLFGQDESIRLNFIVIVDEKTLPQINRAMTNWTDEARKHLNGLEFTYELHLSWFPDDPDINWRPMFKNCSTQRLFFGSILKHIDALIYLDTDTLIVGDVADIWRGFSRMDEQQAVAFVPDGANHYNPELKHPFVGRIGGINAGVALMNLTRLREFELERRATEVYKKWANVIKYGDQDVLNIIFHENPEKILLLPCSFNFIYARCINTQICGDNTEGKGVLIIHGAGGYFKLDNWGSGLKFPIFTWLYRVFNEYRLSQNPETKLLGRLTNEFSSLGLYCSSISPWNLTQNAVEYFENLRHFKPRIRS